MLFLKKTDGKVFEKNSNNIANNLKMNKKINLIKDNNIVNISTNKNKNSKSKGVFNLPDEKEFIYITNNIMNLNVLKKSNNKKNSKHSDFRITFKNKDDLSENNNKLEISYI